MKKFKSQKGFTLIEILVVIGIIAVLAVIVLIAINPGRQFAQSRDTQRVSNVNAILNAIGQRMADNKGTFAGSVGSATCPSIPADTDLNITSSGGTSGTNLDLSCLVPTYISALPTDPTSSSGADTGYNLRLDNTSKRITISATGEVTTSISVTR